MTRIYFALTALVMYFSGSSAFAVVISGPIDYSTSNLVGTVYTGTASSDPTNETAWAQQILDLPAPTGPVAIGGYIYRTGDVDYSGTLSLGTQMGLTGDHEIPAGYEYVLAKYDGKNAGYVLYYLGWEASTIPEFSDSIWTNIAGQGYQISHFTVFNARPPKVTEPTTLSLLGASLIVVGLTNRRRRRLIT